jgi:hypothetical protein
MDWSLQLSIILNWCSATLPYHSTLRCHHNHRCRLDRHGGTSTAGALWTRWTDDKRFTVLKHNFDLVFHGNTDIFMQRELSTTNSYNGYKLLESLIDNRTSYVEFCSDRRHCHVIDLCNVLWQNHILPVSPAI